MTFLKKGPAPSPSQPSNPVQPSPTSLAWNRVDKPERIAWTAELRDLVTKNIEVFMGATDVLMIHPALRSMPVATQINVLCEFLVRIAYYESSYRPTLNSVDVGTEGDLDTYSVGLFQVSVIDQKNHKLDWGYTFKDLQDGVKNIKLMMYLMTNQIRKRGMIFIPKSDNGRPGRYWSTINPGNKHDRTAEITAHIQAMFPGENGEGTKGSDYFRDKLVSYALADEGERETNGPNRSPMIDDINKNVSGGSLGAPYCISGLIHRAVRELCSEHNLEMPKWMNTASTQKFWERAPDKYKTLKGTIGAKKGDICIQQQRTDKSKGHAYMLTRAETSVGQDTIEYNTNPGGSRNGDGVYKRTRTQEGDLQKKYLGAVDVVQAILDHNGVK